MNRFFLHGLMSGLLLLNSGLAAGADICAGLVHDFVPTAQEQSAVHGKGLLFRVSRGSYPANYLYGTMHVSDADIVRLPNPARRAFNAADGFVMEVILTPAEILELAAEMFYNDGTSLKQQLGAEFFDLAVSKLAAHSVSAEVASIMKPWALYLTLAMPPQDAGVPLDLALMNEAQVAGKQIFGLESISEQIEVLAEGSLEDQLDMVRDVVCNYETMQVQIQTMKDDYLARNLAGLLELAQQTSETDEASRRFIERLLWQRNKTMTVRMQPHLALGNMFIAVGALHLPGERGILALLEKRGYTVEVIY